MTAAPFSVCVYCGSRAGEDPAYEAAARQVGTLIGRNGWRLVYGGGRAGLMGVVADATLAAGGTAVGVIPHALMSRELGHPGLTELHVVDTMHERKKMMAERAGAFLALPGGIGTFEELFEVWTWRQLGYHDQPIGLLNVAGYYDELLAFLGKTVERGFLSTAQMDLLQVSDDAPALLARLAALAGGAHQPDDYSAI
ncbi:MULTISPECIES: TIGR00730 family Rossman fold protein [unclassified Rhizobacter]|uniref:LOG family protein n=1 Tax=unclassified Rhizobacter TaxID=2640088 RepID=UPI000701F9DD|nr:MULTISPECIES: TIGR00730 family Rossman fold protein [unclassified Rhizobacter]KQU77081.1 LOG family protein [Rhizobacter sp. Root29]KQW14246.1 LOG family protein [Rhizobacter sp. Root1238]KRB18611.1 LOG family protein [Rhizobacter sp. Root16D2]